jgi:hypothetical protein
VKRCENIVASSLDTPSARHYLNSFLHEIE